MTSTSLDGFETTITIGAPDDWHVHLRDDEMLSAVISHSASWCRYAMVMPNLVPPIETTNQAQHYLQRIKAALDSQTTEPGLWKPKEGKKLHAFQALMTLYLTHGLTAQELLQAWHQGVVKAVKFYPAGATTNSQSGGGSPADFPEVLAAMAEAGIPLLIHSESTDESVDIFDREAVFLQRHVTPLLDRFPKLSVTVEHLSTAAGVEVVKSYSNAYGSITPHHLACDRSDLLANGMRAELYCKPVINSCENKEALVEAATSGDRSFFLGTDSAPHPLAAKEARVSKAGVFNAAYALPVVAEVFYKAGRLEHLDGFVSQNGALRYGFETTEEVLELARLTDEQLVAKTAEEDLPIEMITTANGDEVRLFGVAEANRWQARWL